MEVTRWRAQRERVIYSQVTEYTILNYDLSSYLGAQTDQQKKKKSPTEPRVNISMV
jgi:hypothetical protein